MIATHPKAFEDYFENFDPTYNLFFHAAWSDYEEDGWIFIFEKDSKFFSIEGGHCIMVKDTTPDFATDLTPLTEDEVLEIMTEWQENEEDFVYWMARHKEHVHA